MKKKYLLIYSAIVLFSISAKAVNIPVSVTNNTFTPMNFNAMVGDVVIWTWNSGGSMHNVTSFSAPITAAPFGSVDMPAGTFSYTITAAGSYNYGCTIHYPMMSGSFTVTGTTGILEPSTNLLTSAYPNPFKDKITIKYSGVESIGIFNILGEKVKTIELVATENKIEVDFENLSSGIYFYRTYNEGTIVETKKIVKTK